MMSINDWLDEIKEAKKREKSYRKDGKKILEIYGGEELSPFNILYSNTETLLPALFSQAPRPVVQRRFKDDDPMGKVVSEAAQRMLEYLIDTDVDGYDPFQESMVDATLDGLLPGRGTTSVKYDATITGDVVEYETVCTDTRKWDRVYFGYATKWSNVPWVAYEEYLDKKEFKEKGFSTKGLKFTENEEPENEEETKNKEHKDQGKRKTILVYQIWDKSDKQIKWITPQDKDKYLSIEDDPLGLTGFFNCPKPIQFIRKSNDLIPVALYTIYENQAEELNRIQTRLNRVINAIKVRGVYDGALGSEIENVLKEDDNALLPTDQSALLGQGGLDKAIWFMPVGELIGVAQQLMQARESAKRVIYEITGISDIVRGQSMASETLGAQKIKESWGTMRLKRLQKEAQRYACDTMRLMLDIAVKKFSEKTWAKMTGLPFATTEQREQAQKYILIAQQTGQQPDPKAVQVMQQPFWGDILKVLKDNYSRSYRVDIETNSTLDVEATEDKELVGEFMNAMAQLLNGMAPMVENKSLPFAAFKSIMLGVTRRYRFGREVEDELKAMQEPQPPQSPEMEKAKKQLQQEGEKLQKDKQQLNDERQKAGKSLDKQAYDLKIKEIQFDFEKKLAAQEQNHREQLAASRQDIDQVEAQSQLKEMIVKHKADIQSMLDKHKHNVESCMKDAR